MAEPNPLLNDESFVETIVTLGNKTKTSKDATFAAEYFSNLAKAIATNPTTSRHPKDVLHIATSPSIPRQSVVAPPSTTGEPSNPHNSTPKFTPRLNERLPYSLRKTVGEYQKANLSVLKYLIEYGGFNHEPDLQSAVELDFKDLQGDVRTMKVDRELMRDSDGDEIMVPHIRSHHYEALLDSLCDRHQLRSTASAQAKLREMLKTLELAIAGRSTVHDWHLALPPNDARVADNPKHAAFLKTLLALKDRMEFWL